MTLLNTLKLLEASDRHLAKSAAKGTLKHGFTGKLILSESGWLLLTVPNAIVRGMFDALQEPGVELPLHGPGDKLDAHISVIRPEELKQLGGADKITERGRDFKYRLGRTRSFVPSGWEEMSRVWVIDVISPELRKLRKTYGLTPLPNENKFKFHVTFAVRRKNVLTENETSKAAYSPEPISKWTEGLAVGDEHAFVEYIICHNKEDRDSGELDGLSDKEIRRLKREWQALSTKVKLQYHRKTAELDPSYSSEHPEECCPHCGARLERGDNGSCNRCGKPWPKEVQSNGRNDKQAGTGSDRRGSQVYGSEYDGQAAGVRGRASTHGSQAGVLRCLADRGSHRGCGGTEVQTGGDSKEAMVSGSVSHHDDGRSNKCGERLHTRANAEGRLLQQNPTAGTGQQRGVGSASTKLAQTNNDIVKSAVLGKFAKNTAKEISKAEAATDLHPTPKQIDAGNYTKGKVRLHGLDISIENPKGSTRSGTSEDGKAWSIKMRNSYGYVRGTEAADGDHVDIFLGGSPDTELAFVVNQVDPKTKKYDEPKVMLGFNNQAEAEKAYLANYEKGWDGMGSVTPMTIQQFKWWLDKGNTKKEIKGGFFAAKVAAAALSSSTDDFFASPPNKEGRKCPGCKRLFKECEPLADVTMCEACERYGPPKEKTAVERRTRTHTEEYDVCEHCGKEIGEKALYQDPEGNWFHRPCMDAGPIKMAAAAPYWSRAMNQQLADPTWRPGAGIIGNLGTNFRLARERGLRMIGDQHSYNAIRTGLEPGFGYKRLQAILGGQHTPVVSNPVDRLLFQPRL